MINKGFKPQYFIVDVDGVFTDGSFYYTVVGKVMKKFGPDDNDGLTLLTNKLKVIAVTGDKRGFEITKKRISEDMGLRLELVSTFERLEWIEKNFDAKKCIYMGDGIFDGLVFRGVGYSIAPANAFHKTKEIADFVTQKKGGEGAVAEACIHILDTFYEGFSYEKLDLNKGSGVWKK